LFITCVSIVIVLHSLYKAAVSALFSLVVLLIMLCQVACCTIVWANKRRRKNLTDQHTWLKRRVNATTLGALISFSLVVHAQLASSCTKW